MTEEKQTIERIDLFGSLEQGLTSVLSNAVMIDQRNGIREQGRFGKDAFAVLTYPVLIRIPLVGPLIREAMQYGIGGRGFEIYNLYKSYTGDKTKKQIQDTLDKYHTRVSNLPLEVLPFLLSASIGRGPYFNPNQATQRKKKISQFVIRISQECLHYLLNTQVLEETEPVARMTGPVDKMTGKWNYSEDNIKSHSGGTYLIERSPFIFKRRQSLIDYRIRRKK